MDMLMCAHTTYAPVDDGRLGCVSDEGEVCACMCMRHVYAPVDDGRLGCVSDEGERTLALSPSLPAVSK